jgi:hypothetical protein
MYFGLMTQIWLEDGKDKGDVKDDVARFYGVSNTNFKYSLKNLLKLIFQRFPHAY